MIVFHWHHDLIAYIVKCSQGNYPCRSMIPIVQTLWKATDVHNITDYSVNCKCEKISVTVSYFPFSYNGCVQDLWIKTKEWSMGTSIRAGCVPIKQQFNTELVMKIQDYFFLNVQHILSSETTWFVVLLAIVF